MGLGSLVRPGLRPNADATRKVLQASGLPYDRFQRIEGVADTAPYVPNNPADPRNRRVSITVLNQ